MMLIKAWACGLASFKLKALHFATLQITTCHCTMPETTTPNFTMQNPEFRRITHHHLVETKLAGGRQSLVRWRIWNKKLLGAPGIATRSKDATR